MRDSLEMILFTVSLNSCSAAAPCESGSHYLLANENSELWGWQWLLRFDVIAGSQTSGAGILHVCLGSSPVCLTLFTWT